MDAVQNISASDLPALVLEDGILKKEYNSPANIVALLDILFKGSTNSDIRDRPECIALAFVLLHAAKPVVDLDVYRKIIREFKNSHIGRRDAARYQLFVDYFLEASINNIPAKATVDTLHLNPASWQKLSKNLDTCDKILNKGLQFQAEPIRDLLKLQLRLNYIRDITRIPASKSNNLSDPALSNISLNNSDEFTPNDTQNEDISNINSNQISVQGIPPKYSTHTNVYDTHINNQEARKAEYSYYDHENSARLHSSHKSGTISHDNLSNNSAVTSFSEYPKHVNRTISVSSSYSAAPQYSSYLDRDASVSVLSAHGIPTSYQNTEQAFPQRISSRQDNRGVRPLTATLYQKSDDYIDNHNFLDNQSISDSSGRAISQGNILNQTIPITQSEVVDIMHIILKNSNSLETRDAALGLIRISTIGGTIDSSSITHLLSLHELPVKLTTLLSNVDRSKKIISIDDFFPKNLISTVQHPTLTKQSANSSIGDFTNSTDNSFQHRYQNQLRNNDSVFSPFYSSSHIQSRSSMNSYHSLSNSAPVRSQDNTTLYKQAEYSEHSYYNTIDQREKSKDASEVDSVADSVPKDYLNKSYSQTKIPDYKCIVNRTDPILKESKDIIYTCIGPLHYVSGINLYKMEDTSGILVAVLSSNQSGEDRLVALKELSDLGIVTPYVVIRELNRILIQFYGIDYILSDYVSQVSTIEKSCNITDECFAKSEYTPTNHISGHLALTLMKTACKITSACRGKNWGYPQLFLNNFALVHGKVLLIEPPNISVTLNPLNVRNLLNALIACSLISASSTISSNFLCKLALNDKLPLDTNASNNDSMDLLRLDKLPNTITLKEYKNNYFLAKISFTNFVNQILSCNPHIEIVEDLLLDENQYIIDIMISNIKKQQLVDSSIKTTPEIKFPIRSDNFRKEDTNRVETQHIEESTNIELPLKNQSTEISQLNIPKQELIPNENISDHKYSSLDSAKRPRTETNDSTGKRLSLPRSPSVADEFLLNIQRAHQLRAARIQDTYSDKSLIENMELNNCNENLGSLNTANSLTNTNTISKSLSNFSSLIKNITSSRTPEEDSESVTLALEELKTKKKLQPVYRTNNISDTQTNQSSTELNQNTDQIVKPHRALGPVLHLPTRQLGPMFTTGTDNTKSSTSIPETHLNLQDTNNQHNIISNKPSVTNIGVLNQIPRSTHSSTEGTPKYPSEDKTNSITGIVDAAIQQLTNTGAMESLSENKQTELLLKIQSAISEMNGKKTISTSNQFNVSNKDICNLNNIQNKSDKQPDINNQTNSIKLKPNMDSSTNITQSKVDISKGPPKKIPPLPKGGIPKLFKQKSSNTEQKPVLQKNSKEIKENVPAKKTSTERAPAISLHAIQERLVKLKPVDQRQKNESIVDHSNVAPPQRRPTSHLIT